MDRSGKCCGGEEVDDDGSHARPAGSHTTLARQQQIARDIRDGLVSGDMTPAKAAVALSHKEIHCISAGSPWSSISQMVQVFHGHCTLIQDVELLTINSHQTNRASIYTPPVGNKPSESELAIAPPSNSMAQYQKQVLEPKRGSIAGPVHRRSDRIILDKLTADKEEEHSSTEGMNNEIMAKQLITETRLVSKNRLPVRIDTPSGDGNTQSYEPTASSDRNVETWTVAASIILPKGKQIAVKVFYDSGSSDNMTTEKFVETKGLIKRPILENDLIPYETASSPFVPTEYVEIEVRDDDNEMEEFSKVTFKIAPNLGDHSLIVGRGFMSKHGFQLSREKNRGKNCESLVVTSKPVGKAEKVKQAALAERTKQAQKHAHEVKSSGSTSTGGTTSRDQPTGTSSRTSFSSGVDQKKT